ncbi:MAG: hypothetical protein LBQ44_01550 [Treponema sp.]|jgi:hypothetical protein|nr:hypothetical protein [Treponema sp.]
MKRWLSALFLGGLVLGSLPAATISFLVIETGLPADSARPESSSLWESGMMDSFFDAGHIVSNAPVLRVEHPPRDPEAKFPREASRELDEARLGGADFFVVIFLNYRNNPLGKPGEIQVRIFRVSNGQLLYETACGEYTGDKIEEEFQRIKKNAGKILPYLKEKE